MNQTVHNLFNYSHHLFHFFVLFAQFFMILVLFSEAGKCFDNGRRFTGWIWVYLLAALFLLFVFVARV